jgi:hypothetical protein
MRPSSFRLGSLARRAVASFRPQAPSLISVCRPRINRPVAWSSTKFYVTSADSGANTTSRICFNCTEALPTPLPVCPSCSSISLTPSDITHYELLGVPMEPNPFVIDTKQLKQNFLRSQAICHPDTWASKGAVSLHFSQ